MIPFFKIGNSTSITYLYLFIFSFEAFYWVHLFLFFCLFTLLFNAFFPIAFYIVWICSWIISVFSSKLSSINFFADFVFLGCAKSFGRWSGGGDWCNRNGLNTAGGIVCGRWIQWTGLRHVKRCIILPRGYERFSPLRRAPRGKFEFSESFASSGLRYMELGGGRLVNARFF